MTMHETIIHSFMASEVHDEDYDRLLCWVDSRDYPDEATFQVATREASNLIERYGIAYELDYRTGGPDMVRSSGARWELLRDALEGDTRLVVYYALLLPGGTRQNPSGILRRVRAPRNVIGHSIGTDGHWRYTRTLIDRVIRGTALGEIEELTIGEAAGVLARWRSAGVVPVVLDEDDAPELVAALGQGGGQEQ